MQFTCLMPRLRPEGFMAFCKPPDVMPRRSAWATRQSVRRCCASGRGQAQQAADGSGRMSREKSISPPVVTPRRPRMRLHHRQNRSHQMHGLRILARKLRRSAAGQRLSDGPVRSAVRLAAVDGGDSRRGLRRSERAEWFCGPHRVVVIRTGEAMLPLLRAGGGSGARLSRGRAGCAFDF